MKLLYALLIISFYLMPAYAQQDTIKQQKKDSILNVQLDRQQNRVKQLSAERLAYSLKKAELEKQLSTADNFKKAQLLKELNTFRQKDSLRTVQRKHQIDSLRFFVKGFPVIPFRDTLFYLFTRQGSFTAQDRAAAIGSRINKLSSAYHFNSDSIKLVETEQTTDLIFRDQLLISVSEQDALWQNTTRVKLAELIKNKIGKAVIEHKEETKWQTILKESLLTLLVIVIAGLMLYGVNRLFKRWRQKLARQTGWFAGGIHIKSYELLNAGNVLKALQKVLTVAKWAAIILIIYLALPILFGIFPFTKDFSNTLLNYITNPLKAIAHSVWDYIPNLMTILVLVVVFRYVLKFFKFIASEIAKGDLNIHGFYPDWANPTYQIIRVLILAFMLIVIFPYLPGSDSGVFKGVSVFMGVLFTFGSAGALGNIVAGLVLTYMRAFKIGDRVKIGEVTGDVIEKSLLVTRVRTIQNEIISIPNSTVMSNHTINFSSDAPEKGLIIHTTVTIGYDAPWRQIHQLLITAASSTPMIEQDPMPYVYQTSLDDYYVSYRINAFTREPNKQAAIYSALHANIQDKFNEAGVEIMSPHYKALRDGNTTTIPPDYLPKDYQAPGFVTETRKKS
ncbi:mechanosensitive ion channel family protein [Mucilaginibacter sp. UYCu711]|uniref:mechanosensitive ion channel family protein n=1 Tax=Mucilaginibacter sp. UYCu711 TaxID=3156339 RepID=UPI003D19237B